jgi:hypothetical protein
MMIMMMMMLLLMLLLCRESIIYLGVLYIQSQKEPHRSGTQFFSTFRSYRIVAEGSYIRGRNCLLAALLQLVRYELELNGISIASAATAPGLLTSFAPSLSRLLSLQLQPVPVSWLLIGTVGWQWAALHAALTERSREPGRQPKLNTLTDGNHLYILLCVCVCVQLWLEREEDDVSQAKERRSGTTQIEFEYIKTTLSISISLYVCVFVCLAILLYIVTFV